MVVAFCLTSGAYAGQRKALSSSSGGWEFAGLASSSNKKSALGQLSGSFGSAPDVSVPQASAEQAVSEKRVHIKYFGKNAKTRTSRNGNYSGLSGEDLFVALYDDVNAGAKVLSYGEARDIMYSQVDNVTRNGRNGVMTAYSQVFMPGSSEDGGFYKETGDLNGDGVVDSQGVNAEHSWPQSFFNKALPMKSDLHHLQSTFVTPNGRRGSYPYGMVSAASYSTNSGSKLGDEVFEPCDADKGNTARAMLYFMVRYYDRAIRNGGYSKEFWNEKIGTFLLWNRQDPPDADEIRRNELVFKYQKNRNPFIDDYTLADKVGEKMWLAAGQHK